MEPNKFCNVIFGEILETIFTASLFMNLAINSPRTNTIAAKKILGNNFMMVSTQKLSLPFIRSVILLMSNFIKVCLSLAKINNASGYHNIFI